LPPRLERTLMNEHAPMTDDERKGVVLSYFRRIDRGEEIVSLFDPNADVYFPKWGVAHGRDEVERLFKGLGSLFTEISHNPEYLNVVVDGDLVAAEGLTAGT